MEKLPSLSSTKETWESWEVIKELHTLSKRDLREKLRSASPLELNNIETACGIAADSTGGDGGLHNSRYYARRSGMTVMAFDQEIRRISDVIHELRKEERASEGS